MSVSETGRNWVRLTWQSPYGAGSGGNVKIYYKEAWSFKGKQDGIPVIVPSNGMNSGSVVIPNLDRKTCYKFAAYQHVGQHPNDVLLGITKEKTNR